MNMSDNMRLLLAIAMLSSSCLFAQSSSTTTDFSQPQFAPATPQGFNPLTASDADLRVYGFPPRPANNANLLTMVCYSSWDPPGACPYGTTLSSVTSYNTSSGQIV